LFISGALYQVTRAHAGGYESDGNSVILRLSSKITLPKDLSAQAGFIFGEIPDLPRITSGAVYWESFGRGVRDDFAVNVIPASVSLPRA
jgi:hypothetical protein